MSWDFSTDPEFQKKLDWVEEFCREEVEPLEFVFPYAIRSKDPKIRALVRGLQDQVKDQGLWAIFLDEDLGGPGYGQLKLGLLNEILGRYPSAPQMFGAAAPDTGNMEMLAAYGTEEQKKRWLEPMINQDMFSAYSMTEPQGGSDPNLFRTHAEKDGDEWVINGEKWFTSAGRVADILFVMCTNGMFVVPRETPGVDIQPEPRNHNHIIYRDVRVPADHLLGPEDGAKVLAQRRLGGGRIHHAMRTIAQCKLAFDMMCERALSRESHGKIIAEHQMVQEKIADSYASIRMLRLFVLETAWKIDNTSTQETRTDIAAVKYTMAKVLREVSFNALHILGSLGTTNLTPLQAMYAAAPTMGIADGVDEVHKSTVARNVLKSYRPHEGYWPTEYYPAKREKAWEKFEPKFAADPELRKMAEEYAKYLTARLIEMSGLNIADIFETVVATVPDSPALVVRTGDGHNEVRLSFAELDARANQLAHAMLALGVGEGDHVGTHLYDGNQYVEVTLAAYKVRAVPVNVNFRYVDEELTYLFDNADLKLVVTEPDLEDRASRAAATLAWECPVVVADERYEALLAQQLTTALDVGDRSPDDHYGLWTGGTTGMPKGVIWRQEDIYLSAIGGGGNPLLGIEPVVTLDDVVARARKGTPLPGTLTLCPLMHGGGFWLAFSAILSGSFAVLIRDVGFDPAFALRVIGEERASLLMTIGDAYARPIVDLLESSQPGDFDLSSLLVYGSGGAILSPSVKDDLARLLPTTVVHDGFGASETGGQGRLTGTGADGAPSFDMDPGNVVIAEDGTLCEPGDGRIGMLANSGHIPLGYYKDEVKTAATFPVIDGVRYAVPGDLASVDENGYIAVYGRGSVSINSGGEKIFPEEVEKALKRHPAVFDATVVGTPNERFGSQVTAVVELRPEHADSVPSLADLQDHCREHLAGYKVPRAVVFVDDTVRSPSGKPDYRWAKETALAALAEPSTH